jgi:hypothetical protein
LLIVLAGLGRVTEGFAVGANAPTTTPKSPTPKPTEPDPMDAKNCSINSSAYSSDGQNKVAICQWAKRNACKGKMSEFGPCSASCGPGKSTKKWVYDNPTLGIPVCGEVAQMEIKDCNAPPCPTPPPPPPPPPPFGGNGKPCNSDSVCDGDHYCDKVEWVCRRQCHPGEKDCGCFHPETKIQLQTGEIVQMQNLKSNDVLANGSIVYANLKLLNDSSTNLYYKFSSAGINKEDIYVTQEHLVLDGNGNYIQVQDHPNAIVCPNKKTDYVLSLITSDHKIKIGTMTFWDWEDDVFPIAKLSTLNNQDKWNGICFDPENEIALSSGKVIKMKDLKLGDILSNGSVVTTIFSLSPVNKTYYKITNNETGNYIHVSGDHYVMDENNKFILIKNHPDALITDKQIESCISIVTTGHTIKIGGKTFWDWEDDILTQTPRPGLEKLYSQMLIETKKEESFKNQHILV